MPEKDKFSASNRNNVCMYFINILILIMLKKYMNHKFAVALNFINDLSEILIFFLEWEMFLNSNHLQFFKFLC